MTDEVGAIVWQAEYLPFGAATVNEDPDGDTMSNLYEYRAGYDPYVFDGPLTIVIPMTTGFVSVLLVGAAWFGRKRLKKPS